MRSNIHGNRILLLFDRGARQISRGMTTLRSTLSLPNRVVPTLRQHPPSTSTPPPTFPFLTPELVPPRTDLDGSPPPGKIFKLTWPTNPRNIFIVKKPHDERVKEAAVAFAKYYYILNHGTH